MTHGKAGRMHIGIVIWNLMENHGGIQRVGVDLAHAMMERGHRVSLFYYSPQDKKVPCFPVNAGIGLHRLVVPPQVHSLSPAQRLLQSANLDVLVPMFSWSKLLWFPALLEHTGIPWVLSEHNHPEIINTERWNAYERHACLRAADRIHLLQESFVPFLPVSLRHKVRVIGNATLFGKATPRKRERGDRKRLLAAGRFVERQKQFSLLIEAFTLLREAFSGWDLVLAGSGPDERRYKAFAEQCGLGSRISFPGMVSDMASYYSSSDLLCIPSRFEGFPLVPLEAQSHALAVVGFAGCPGVNDFIAHGENGLLAEKMTAASLAEQLAILMKDEPLRKQMGERGRSRLARYAPDCIYDQWEQLLVETACCKDRTQLQTFRQAGVDDPLAADLGEILARPLPFPYMGTVRYRLSFRLKSLFQLLLSSFRRNPAR